MSQVLRLFEQAGLGFECVSPGEVEHVLELFPDIDRDAHLFTPNFAPREEYVFGFDDDLHVTLDNLHPLETWPEVFEGREVIVRMDPGRGRGPPQVRAYGRPAVEVRRRAVGARPARGARRGGRMRRWLGSTLTSEAASKTEYLVRDGGVSLVAGRPLPDLRVLNLGGGLGVPQRRGQRVDMDAVAEQLATFKTSPPRVRALDGAGPIHGRGGGRAPGARHANQAEGRYSVRGPGDRHELADSAGALRRLSPDREPLALDEPRELTAEVVGPICETAISSATRGVAQTETGDVFFIATTGAYGRAMSSATTCASRLVSTFCSGH